MKGLLICRLYHGAFPQTSLFLSVLMSLDIDYAFHLKKKKKKGGAGFLGDHRANFGAVG